MLPCSTSFGFAAALAGCRWGDLSSFRWPSSLPRQRLATSVAPTLVRSVVAAAIRRLYGRRSIIGEVDCELLSKSLAGRWPAPADKQQIGQGWSLRPSDPASGKKFERWLSPWFGQQFGRRRWRPQSSVWTTHDSLIFGVSVESTVDLLHQDDDDHADYSNDAAIFSRWLLCLSCSLLSKNRLHRHHPKYCMNEVHWIMGGYSLLFSCSKNHVENSVRVERQLPVRPWLIGILLVLLRFDRELHGNIWLSPVRRMENLRLNYRPRTVPFSWRQPKRSSVCQVVCTPLVEA